MKLTLKIISIFVLLLIASPVLLLKGCGSALNGGASGACPDSVAPSGSKINAPTDLDVPNLATGTCYALPFTVTEADGVTPMNGICVEVTTNAVIALHTVNDPNCTNVVAGAKTTIVTRTDEHGIVFVDLVTLPTVTGTFFVEVASGSASGVATTPAAQ
jgi:hypothetical protein